MYKRYIPISLVALFIMGTLGACQDEFLEVSPKGKLIAQTVADYHLLFNNLELVNMNSSAQIPMGDEVAAIEPYFQGANLKTQRLFRWDEIIYEPSENAPEIEYPLKNLYLYNKIINEVSEAIDGTASDKKSLEAEALAGRAWTYFLLINYFGKPYQESSASSDLGFPIIKQAEVTQNKFTRASVKDVYTFIVEDLQKAIPNLPTRASHRVRMSKAAAEGLLGKVYLFMGKSELALPHLDAAISDLKNSDIETRLYDYNITLAPGGEFLPIGNFGPSYPYVANIKENIYAKQSFSFWSFSANELVLTREASALYEASDLRLKFYSKTALYGPAYPDGLLRKAGPSNVQIGLVVPELYLLRSECKARLNDLAGAIADLEMLRKHRMPAADAQVSGVIANDKLSLIRFILEERIREFAMTGYRWFDMRRLSVDPLFSASSYTHYLYNEDGSVKDKIDLPTDRLVLRLPQKIINENLGMENNN